MSIILNILKKLFPKSKKSDTLSLYKDYILVVDLEDQDHPQIRFCWIKKVDGNEVTVTTTNSDNVTVVWIPEHNNFFFKDQLDIVNNLNFKSLKTHNSPKAVSQG